MPSPLEAHRQRIAALDSAMERLQAMHGQAYDLWDRIVHLARSDAPDRYEQLDALHDQSYALAEQIAVLREETFGSISRESRLRLSSTVESIHPSLVGGEAEPLGGP